MKRDPVVIIVVAMVVTVMIVFGFQIARRGSGQTADGRLQHEWPNGAGFHSGITGRQDGAPL